MTSGNGGLPAGGVLERQAPACYPAPGRSSGSTGTKEETSTVGRVAGGDVGRCLVNLGGGGDGLRKTQ